MENFEATKNTDIKKSKTLTENPEYFGAYLNMARLNIFKINNHLASKFGYSSLNDEGEIPNSFLVQKITKNQNHIFSQLKKFMPIARVFDEESLPKFEQENIKNLKGKDINKLSENLAIIFKELNEFRNDYTHYYSIKTGTNRKMKISNQLSTFLEENFIRAIHYTKDRFRDVYTEDDFSIASKTTLFDKENIITQDGIVFLISIFLDRENAFQFINKIKYLKGTQNKTFTAKREVLSAFCIKLPHEKFISENSIQAFSLELINELSKCPKTLYAVITEDEKKVFQPILGNEELENIHSNSIPETINDYEAYIESITKRVRNKNRFSYFAMRFLDEKEVFKKIRFQINLGKIIIAEYEKMLDGKQEQRKVIEEAKAFGRLQDFKVSEESILNKINTSSQTEFEQFSPHYNFDDKTGKIGINITKEDTAKFINRPKSEKKIASYLKQPQVDAFLSIHELPKIILLEYLEKGKTETLISNFIDANNSKIMNIEFIEMIKTKLSHLTVFNKRSQGRKQKTAYYNETLKDLHQRKTELNHVLNEYGLNDKQIPSKILNYWLKINEVQEKTVISDRIKLMKRECIDRLRAVKKGRAPKIGEMATFLAKDIVDMIIDENKKQKVTSFYYDKIQECLALYTDDEMKTKLVTLFNELLLNEKGGHPFLKKIDFSSLKYTSEIYINYLQEKGQKLVPVFNYKSNKYSEKDQSWLQTNFYTPEWNEKAGKNLTVVRIPDDVSKLPYSIRQLKKEKKSFETWLAYVSKGKENNDRRKPIDLPTNLFDDTIKKLLSIELKKHNIPINKEANYNELLKLWWEKCRMDGTQSFYNAQREYTFEEQKLNFHINTKEKFEHYYKNGFLNNIYRIKKIKRNEEKKTNKKLPEITITDVEKSIRNKIGQTEKKIRLLQEEDRLLILMFEQLIDKKDLEPKLKNIEILLNETLSIKEKITGNLVFDNSGEIIEKEKIQISRYISENRKRKDFSVLKKYVHDRRLPELFEYFDNENIPIESLKTELDSYNKAKETVFELIFELEKTIITKDKESIETLHELESKECNVFHRPYLNWLLSQDIITKDDYVFMNMVRKSFSHNQFPHKKTMEIHIHNWNEDKYASQIVNKYKDLVEKTIISTLKK